MENGNDDDGQSVLDYERERRVDCSAVSDGPLFVAVNTLFMYKIQLALHEFEKQNLDPEAC